MAYTITADSTPLFDGWGPDDYWSVSDWQVWYDALVAKYGAEQGSRKWLDAWWQQSSFASPVNNEGSIADWAKSRGLYKGWSFGSSGMKKSSEYVPPYNANQGQVVTTVDPKTGLPTTNTIGVQPNLTPSDGKKEIDKTNSGKGWLIAGGILLVALTATYFVLRAKNKAK